MVRFGEYSRVPSVVRFVGVPLLIEVNTVPIEGRMCYKVLNIVRGSSNENFMNILAFLVLVTYTGV